jgi:hypothetical protein
MSQPTLTLISRSIEVHDWVVDPTVMPKFYLEEAWRTSRILGREMRACRQVSLDKPDMTR